MNSTTWAVIIVAIIVIIGGAWWYASTQPGTNTNVNIEQPQGTNETGSNVPGGSVEVGAPVTITVTRTASGFSPETVTIKKGDTVTWTDDAAGSMWVATNQHPSHTLYSGTSREEHCPAGSALAFDQCATGTTYSFKFDKAGSWQYHNHSASSELGTVIVQ